MVETVNYNKVDPVI